jgi:hypothetical protein
MILIQVFAAVFIVFAVSRVFLRLRDKKITIIEVMFWLSIWIGMTVIVFFPRITQYLADMLGIGRGIDVIIYASIAILFYLIFRLYIKIEDTEREITLLVRELTKRK